MTTSEWRAARLAGPIGGRPPSPDEWHPVAVPGRPARFSDASIVAYRRTFEDPRETADERILLTLHGCYAHTRVWVDGSPLGDHDAYYLPARWTFDPGETDEFELIVACQPPRDRFGGIHDTELLPPDRRVPGIWWDIAVEAVPDPCLLDVSVAPRPLEDGAAIDLDIDVATSRTIDDRVTISVRPDGFAGGGAMGRARVRASADERATVPYRIELPDPRRWWPAELGAQHRYAVRVALGDHERTVTTGICGVSMDEDGILVNGVRLPLRGFNLLDGDDPVADVDRARAANANVIRAHAMVPPHSFHERCDESGLLVWQDLPLTGPGGYDIERGRTLLDALRRRYGHHPSIASWGVHDDPRDPLAGGVGRGRLARARARWRIWRTSYDRSAADRIGDVVEDRPVIAVAGPPGTGPDAWSLYPGWAVGEATTVEWLVDEYMGGPGFVGEFGAGSFGNAVVDDAAGFDREIHDRYVPEATPESSHRYQAGVLKTVAEYLRYRGCPAVVAFALRDVDAAGFGVYGADGAAKPGLESLRSAFEPIQAIMTPPPRAGRSSRLAVINDTRERIVGELTWSVGERAGETTVSVDGADRMSIGSVDVPTDADVARLSLSIEERTIENRYHVER